MASKKIYLVFQDCTLCGARKEWGKAQLAKADTAGVVVEKIPFTHASDLINAKDLILRAAKAGMHLPFFTDGENFGQNVDDLLAQTSESAEAKPAKKTRKKRNGTTKTN